MGTTSRFAATVLKPFTGIEEGVVFMPGDRFEGTRARVDGLAALGYVRPAKTAAQAERGK